MARDPTPQQVALILGPDPAHRELESLINRLTSSMNSHRGEAASLFKACYEANPDAHLIGLTHLLRSSPNPDTRTMSSILLRLHFTRNSSSPFLWDHLSPKTQYDLKSLLLSSLPNESLKSITKKICYAVSELASAILPPLKSWPELLPLLFQWVQSEDRHLQKISLIIFSHIPALICKIGIPKLATLHAVFLRSLSASDVGIATLAAIVNLILCPSASCRHKFDDLLPLMMQTPMEAVNSGNEAMAQDALELLVELAWTYPSILRHYTAEAVWSMLQVAEESLEEGTRHLAIEFVVTVGEATAPLVRREINGVLRQFLSRLFTVVMDFMLDLEDGFGLECLDRLVIPHRGDMILPVALELLPGYLGDMEWKRRHAALIALAQIAESYTQENNVMMINILINNLQQILSLVLESFDDAHPRVQWAAINAIRQLSRYTGPHLQDNFHHLVLPVLIEAMGNFQNPPIQAHATSVLRYFTESCTPDILKPYLVDIVGMLFLLLEQGMQMVQREVVVALASVADSSKEHFVMALIPYIKAARS